MKAARPELIAAAAGACFCLLVMPLPVAAPCAALVTLGVLRWLPLLDSSEERQRDLQQLRELPLALDVLALCLDAGISWDRATRLAASGTGDPIRSALDSAAGRLSLGAAPDEVWQGAPSLHIIGSVVERSFRSGGAVSTLLRQQADAMRATERMQRIAAVRRLETTILLPLTALGLPAFFIGGVVPAGVSMYMQMLGPLLSTAT